MCQDSQDYELAFHHDERLIVVVLNRGAWASEIQYTVEGMNYIVHVPNDELTFLGGGFSFESE